MMLRGRTGDFHGAAGGAAFGFLVFLVGSLPIFLLPTFRTSAVHYLRLSTPSASGRGVSDAGSLPAGASIA